ncbi:hypothetical protein BJ742DRAFT_829687 [Cladochytrium replicatum]|nr:hypothetical protein BJ742DRAFT_829687 [Cladochytrium replicatum]
MAPGPFTFAISPITTALISTASSALGFLLSATFVAIIDVCLPTDAELRLSAAAPSWMFLRLLTPLGGEARQVCGYTTGRIKGRGNIRIWALALAVVATALANLGDVAVGLFVDTGVMQASRGVLCGGDQSPLAYEGVNVSDWAVANTGYAVNGRYVGPGQLVYGKTRITKGRDWTPVGVPERPVVVKNVLQLKNGAMLWAGKSMSSEGPTRNTGQILLGKKQGRFAANQSVFPSSSSNNGSSAWSQIDVSCREGEDRCYSVWQSMRALPEELIRSTFWASEGAKMRAELFSAIDSDNRCPSYVFQNDVVVPTQGNSTGVIETGRVYAKVCDYGATTVAVLVSSDIQAVDERYLAGGSGAILVLREIPRKSSPELLAGVRPNGRSLMLAVGNGTGLFFEETRRSDDGVVSMTYVTPSIGSTAVRDMFELYLGCVNVTDEQPVYQLNISAVILTSVVGVLFAISSLLRLIKSMRGDLLTRLVLRSGIIDVVYSSAATSGHAEDLVCTASAANFGFSSLAVLKTRRSRAHLTIVSRFEEHETGLAGVTEIGAAEDFRQRCTMKERKSSHVSRKTIQF